LDSVGNTGQRHILLKETALIDRLENWNSGRLFGMDENESRHPKLYFLGQVSFNRDDEPAEQGSGRTCIPALAMLGHMQNNGGSRELAVKMGCHNRRPGFHGVCETASETACPESEC
jgi:hypothetical protein